MILQTHNLCFDYNTTFRLDGLNLHITANSLTAIMGLNGSGKSTLISLLSGFLKPQSGEVLLKDRPLSHHSSIALAQQISVVPQDFPTLFPYSVEEFVMMGTYPWKTTFFDSITDQKNVQTILTELELSDFAKRKINTLSGGERQRVLLARALAQNTPLLLLDEPLNHLDIKHQLVFLKKLKALCQTHSKTIIAVMHDLNAVQKHFDNIVFLKNGQLVFAGVIAQGFTPNILENVFETTFADLSL